jgi:hypothetical protein
MDEDLDSALDIDESLVSLPKFLRDFPDLSFPCKIKAVENVIRDGNDMVQRNAFPGAEMKDRPAKRSGSCMGVCRASACVMFS